MKSCSDEVRVHPSLLRRYKKELVFVLCACLYILPFMRVLVFGTDEGTLISGAARIVQGQIFARDFFEVMGPGTFYWLAVFFKLFGVTFAATRICLFVTSTGTLLSMFYLSERMCKSYAVLPPLLLIATYCWTWPTISHHTDSNLFALLSVLSAYQWVATRRFNLLFLAGMLAGITTCFLQPKGILLLVALLVWLIVEHSRTPGSVTASACGSLIGGYSLAMGIVILYFARHGALHDLIYANVIWPHQNYGGVNVVPYARGVFAYYWDIWNLKSPAGYVISAILIIPYLLTAALPFLLPLCVILWRGSLVSPEVRLLWLCGLGMWLSEIHRKDIVHLVFGSPLLLILIVYYAEKLPARASQLVLQVMAVGAVCLSGYNLLLLLYTHSLQTKVGAVSTFRDEKLVRVLEQTTYPGEEIFAYPYCPIYYFLTGTINPTRYSILMYHYNTPAEFEEVLQVLQRRRVKYVVWNTYFQAAINHKFPSAGQVPAASQIIEPYLESHYRQIWADRDNRLMELKSDVPSGDRGAPSDPALIHLQAPTSLQIGQK